LQGVRPSKAASGRVVCRTSARTQASPGWAAGNFPKSAVIPAIVASCRHHNATGAIIVLNIFLGWTFIGWVIALVWASTNDLRKEPRGLRSEPRAWVRRTLPGGNQTPTDRGTLDRPATLRFTELKEAGFGPR
jgi:hypothetical protein